jgi:mannose-1-phosphate guanylyltransferase/phosphomannomutase
MDVRPPVVKVVVLAGGKGTRLGLQDRPKPMVLVSGKPLLERLVEMAKANGMNDFIFLTGYKADMIEEHFGNGDKFGVRIEHVRESQPLGTAGAVRAARHLLDETFVVLYGDVLMNVDLTAFLNFHQTRDGVGSVFVHPNDHPQDSDLVVADATGRVTSFLPKPHRPGVDLPNLVNAALYVLEPRALDHVAATGPSDWGREVLPHLVDGGERVFAYRSLEYAKDIGTPVRITQAEADLRSGRVERLSLRTSKPAIFVDRDGVLNTEIDGVHLPEQLALLDGVGEAVRRANQAGIPVICVTNQPDIAKGFLTTEALDAVHAALDTRLAEAGAYLDDLLYCPHHPEQGWPNEVVQLKIECTCRKPRPGMLLQAARSHNLDLAHSWLIGDRHADIAAAHAAGARGALVKTGHAGDDKMRFADEADAMFADLPEALAHIVGDLS